MSVKDYMQKDPSTICGEASLPEAMDYLHHQGVVTLPVMDGKKVVGVLTDRDVRKAGSSSNPKLHTYDLEYLLSKVKVSDIMSRMVVSISPHDGVEEAAQLLHDRKISGLPVIENGELLGLITINEVLELFSSLFEKEEKSVNFELKLDSEGNNLSEALRVITEHGGNVKSVVTAPIEGKGSSAKEIILGIEGDDVEGIKNDLKMKDLILSAN